MKALFLLFTLFNFISVQAMAGTCQVVCEYNKELKNIDQVHNKSKPMPMKANHECCHGKESSKEKTTDRPFQCFGELGGLCLHESSAVSSTDLVELINFSISDFAFISVALFYRPLLVDSELSTDPPHLKYGGNQYLRFKKDLRLHVLKDQFLI